MFKSNIGTNKAEAKSPLKLPGFSISKPKVKSQPNKVGEARRSVKKVSAKTLVEVAPKAPAVARKAPIQSLSTDQKIERAKQSWERIKTKALDHLRVDESTRHRLDELRSEYYRSSGSFRLSDYERSLRDLLGNESYVFLYNAREEFKARIYERAQIEIGPHLGEL